MPQIRDTFYATENLGPVNYIYPTLRSSFGITTRQSVTVGTSLLETFEASETLSARAFTLIQEQFSASETLFPAATFSYTYRDSFRALGRASGSDRVSAELKDSFVAQDWLDTPVIKVRLADSAVATGSAIPTGRSARTVRELFRARGHAYPRNIARLHDEFFASDGYTLGSNQRKTYRDVFSALGRASAQVQGRGMVRERFSALDTTSFTTIARENVREQAWFISTAHPEPVFEQMESLSDPVPLTATDMWTADMMSWGMSRYVGTNIWDFSGTQFGLGRDGIFTASEDEADLALIKTGEMPLFREQEPIMERKRINYVYSYARQLAPLRIAVNADYNNERLVTEYTQPDRASTDTRAVRTAVGRGYVTNYVQLAIGESVLFDLTGLEVETTVTGRRI